MPTTKIQNTFRIFATAAAGLYAVFLLLTSGVLYAQATPQPYDTDTNLPVGTVVQLDESNSKKVKPASMAALDKMFGVIVSSSNLPITVTSDTSASQKYVATDGKYSVLVSDENGGIKTGDNITVSNLKGTAMKASNKQETLFGKALSGFDGKNNVIGVTSLKYDNGKKAKNVNLGIIQVAIDIRHNPDVLSTKTRLPPQLERIGEQIAEKELSPFRIYLSVAVLIIAVIIAIVILYSGIRNSVISIGRNPLSRKTIFRGLLQIILVAFIVLIIGMFTVYLLLKL